MEEKKIFVDNLEVNYKIAGSGPAVLILHGWGGSSDSWIAVQEILAKQGYKAICPDLPGFGKSKTPSRAWEVTDYAEFVNKFTRFLNIDNFFIISHSFGGRVAISFAGTYPEKLKRLVLCNSAGIKPNPGIKTRIIFQFSKIGNAIFSPKISARFKDGARNIFYVFLRHKDYAKANGVMKETIKKVLNEDLTQDLSKIRTKTLIVWGEKDKMVPVKYAQVFKEKIKDSQLVILPKIGHSPHLEAPEKLSKILIPFLKG